MGNFSDEQREIILEFVQESLDTIEQLEPTIIELGQKAGDPQVLNVIFRLFHSMKGTASFLELKNIANVSHAAENLLDLIRSGEIEMKSPDHVNLLIETSDFAKEALGYVEANLEDEGMSVAAGELSSRIQKAIAEASETGEEAKEEKKEEPPVIKLDEDEKAGEEERAATEEQRVEPPAERDKGFAINPDMVERFVQESDELLQDIEQGLLAWLDDPGNKEIVAELFRNFHSFKGNCGFFGYLDLERLSHRIETVLDDVKRDEPIGKNSAAELLLQLKDVLRDGVADISEGGEGNIEALHIYMNLLEDLAPKRRARDEGKKAGAEKGLKGIEIPKRLGEILIEEGMVTEEDLEKALQTQLKPVGEILVDMGATTDKDVQTALDRQEKKKAEPPPKTEEKAPRAVKRQDIRVDLVKLDNLINLIGELVIAENMLVSNPDLDGLELENFHKAAQQTSKIVRELQEMAMVIRMIPVSGLFRRMIRLVHDLSGKFGKKVELKIDGEETEVDKTIIETITDPLVHMIRNAVDHGLETPEERAAAGKPEKGTIKLSARHEEGEVWIIVEDDGHGLDREKILAKARAQGLIEDDGAEMPDKAIYNLIFMPGFSTAEQISDVSGRGVGMDVVRQNLDKIKCKIEIQSKLGLGTRFILRIPLTLAIIEGMLIRVGGSKYILPIMSIRESFCPEPGAITVSTDGQELARVREEFIPVLRLHELHNIEPTHKELTDGILVVLDSPDGAVALFVDEILGQQQTVIKGLSKYITKVNDVHGVSGCTILGNGDVCLILDVGGLVETALAEAARESAG
ncbi:MAG: chemotaxis protein CheA [Candidatus Nitrospinota bacterium M3_3B_026]